MYTIRIKNTSGTEIFDIPFKEFAINEALNRGVDGVIKCSYQALKEYAEALHTTYNNMLKSVYREVEIYRNGVLFHTLVLNKKSSSKDGLVTLYVSDYISMLGTRITANEGTKYTATDSAEIAWDEIDLSQIKTNGDFGITLGTQPTTKDRQRTLRFDNLLDLVVGMSNLKVVDGYDFEITKTKQLNFYYPQKGFLKDNIVLDDRNMIKWSVSEGLAGNVVNRVAVLGKGGDADMVTSVREDTTNQSKWGLHEGTLSEKGVSDVDGLSDRGDKFLEDNDTPEDNRQISITHIDGTPSIDEYALGDSVSVRILEEDISENLRVISRKITLKKSALEVTLGFE